MKPRYLLLLSFSGFIVSLDQAINHYVYTHLRVGEARELLGSGLKVVHLSSNGLFFGLLHRIPQELQEIFLVGVPVFALVLLILIFVKLNDGRMLSSLSLTLILAGALGNILDRVQYGSVVDPFVVPGLPSFNLADLAILCGASLMMINTLLQQKKKIRIGI